MVRPRLALLIIRILTPLAERDELAADLAAEFDARRASHGRVAASAWLWGQVLRSTPSLIGRLWWRGSTGFEPQANAMRPGGPLMERLLLEARYAIRRLRTRPTYSLLAVLTLALGVGGMAAIAGIARSLLVDPLPYHRPTELVDFWAGGSWRAPEWLAVRSEMTDFAGVAAYRTADWTVERPGARTRLAAGIRATHELFDVLGVKPMIGRGFARGEDAVGAAPLVVLSYKMWRELGASPSIVGSHVKLDGVERTVIGVMPPGFWFPVPTIEAWANEVVEPKANYGIYSLVGRLPAGKRADQMQPAVDRITRFLGSQFKYSGRFDKTKDARLRPLQEWATSDARPALLATLAGMSIILLIACANVAALVLSQVESRTSEFALRTALGADRGRLASQLLIETLILGVTAGVVGTAVAMVSFNLLRGALSLGPWTARASLDWKLFALSLAVGIASALVVVLLPIVALWRTDLRGTLAGARTGGILRRRGGFQGMMIVSEVALGVLLACAAGLLVRSVAKMYAIHPGFDTRGLAVVDVAMPANLNDANRRRALERIVGEISSLPGVTRVAYTQRIPLRGPGWSANLRLPDAPPDAPTPYFRFVSANYLATLGIPVLRGRSFDAADAARDTIPSILVNEALVKIYFPGVDPIGREVPSNFVSGVERIVGVVANVSEATLTGETTPPARYLLADNFFIADMQTLVIRTARADDAEHMLSRARDVIARTAPNLAVQDATTMSRVVDRAVGPARDVMALLALLTGLALVLGAVGIYGVISQFVTRRARDWGIRVALGLAPRRVVTLVVSHGTTLVLAGIAIGAVGATVLGRFLSSFLYGVTPTDPIAIGAASVVLLLVGTLAALVPAVRASRTDPAVVLRDQ